MDVNKLKTTRSMTMLGMRITSLLVQTTGQGLGKLLISAFLILLKLREEMRGVIGVSRGRMCVVRVSQLLLLLLLLS